MISLLLFIKMLQLFLDFSQLHARHTIPIILLKSYPSCPLLHAIILNIK
jgi:hypothetical protein